MIDDVGKGWGDERREIQPSLTRSVKITPRKNFKQFFFNSKVNTQWVCPNQVPFFYLLSLSMLSFRKHMQRQFLLPFVHFIGQLTKKEKCIFSVHKSLIVCACYRAFTKSNTVNRKTCFLRQKGSKPVCCLMRSVLLKFYLSSFYCSVGLLCGTDTPSLCIVVCTHAILLSHTAEWIQKAVGMWSYAIPIHVCGRKS